MRQIQRYWILIILMVLVLPGYFAFAISYEKEPIKKTQSNTVAVTDELLEREGQLGPASPTIKMASTSEFLVEKPYSKAEEEGEGKAGEIAKPWWERWFFWAGDKKKEPFPESD